MSAVHDFQSPPAVGAHREDIDGAGPADRRDGQEPRYDAHAGKYGKPFKRFRGRERQQLRSHTQASKSALDGVISDLRSVVLSARRADEQNRWLYIIGGGGVLVGLLLYALLAGPIAQLAPANWQWPERMAARVLDQPTPWDAGQHLMASASRPSWEAIVAPDRLLRDNRETIDRCRASVAKAKMPVRCTIVVKAKEDLQ